MNERQNTNVIDYEKNSTDHEWCHELIMQSLRVLEAGSTMIMHINFPPVSSVISQCVCMLHNTSLVFTYTFPKGTKQCWVIIKENLHNIPFLCWSKTSNYYWQRDKMSYYLCLFKPQDVCNKGRNWVCVWRKSESPGELPSADSYVTPTKREAPTMHSHVLLLQHNKLRFSFNTWGIGSPDWSHL